MNLQMADQNLKKCFGEIRKLVPKQVEFAIGSLISAMMFEIQRNGASGVPLKNVHMLIDFTKKYMNRVYTENALELFTEQIDMDTIELLQNKGHSISSLASEKKRKQVLEELKVDQNEVDTINQFYQGLPVFKIESTKAYVEGHDNIEEGDFVRVKVKITLVNSEEPLVVDNILRKSFIYPGEDSIIPKTPFLYLFMTDKSGNLQGFDKIPFIKFVNEDDGTIQKSVIHTSVLSFGVEGDKKINIKVMNDSFLTENKGLDEAITIKVLPKSEPVEEIDNDDQESIEGSEGDSRQDYSDEELEEEPDKKND
eukprot:CAMPEP_0197002220 /NCGR_PEP_ID=MMETSP1380-20130617/6748_1 /TAXON_ID=5936 /ORGANISM="Euplotes crassus, Strain CT5" /LENGTH=309 /DNA_ID=CAMNT_0042420241 /DNA_START=781 /DNA_END=1707 /DNA_ORIENTATION=+